MRIAITGADGQLGSALCGAIKGSIPLTRDDIDFCSLDTIEDKIRDLNPDILINCAAFTNVDGAEVDRLLCLRVNNLAVMKIGQACEKIHCKVVQMSTDYVFTGNTIHEPLKETDRVSPYGAYAQSKYLSEKWLLDHNHALIIRTCGLYTHDKPCNFFSVVRTLAQKPEMKIVNDQWCVPTYIPDFVCALRVLLDSNAGGLYHVTNSGSCTWFEYAKEVVNTLNLESNVVPISTAEYAEMCAPKVIAKRPEYSVLDCSKYSKVGNMRSWKDALLSCIESSEG